MNGENTNIGSTGLELRYLCHRIQQIHLLYRLLHSQHTTDASPSESATDVQASIHLFVEAISAEISQIAPKGKCVIVSI